MIDEDEDDLITFKELAQGLGAICKGELQDRLEFMYRMHVLTDVTADASDSESVDSCCEMTEGASTEDLVTSSQPASRAHSEKVEVVSSDLSTEEESPVRTLLRNMEFERRAAEEKRSDELPRMNQVSRW